MTSNLISNLIKTTCIQMTQSIIMNAIMKNFLPSLSNLFRYINCLGLINILIYFLIITVLLYILYKLFKFIKKIFYRKSKHCKSKSNLLNKNISREISSFESRSSDFQLEPKKKIIHVTKSSSSKKNKLSKIKNLIKSESLLSSSF